jgi:hypothetical protein
MDQEYIRLATRKGFNRALHHFINTLKLNDALEGRKSFADVLIGLYESAKIEQHQIMPILNAILVSKFGCQYRSMNLCSKYNDFEQLSSKVKDWNAVNLSIVYHSPALGICLMNPKNINHLKAAQDFTTGQMLVVYAFCHKGKDEKERKKIATNAVDAVIKIINKQPIENEKDCFAKFIDKSAKPAQRAPAAAPAAKQKAAPTPAPPAGGKSRRATPKYAVQVSNELFHNGNVEAWKNIIESYHTFHPENQVIVYHEGELIQDLNSLFKWGKVKHAGLIFFQIIGSKIKGVSKLQKYLYEGASPRYEAFLKHDVSKVLKLF